jgi:two-component system chemotaxis response regulator CheY
MSKKILLVGHCGPDGAYLTSAVRSAVKEATVLAADDETELRQKIDEGVDLVLFNRELGYGFPEAGGVAAIRELAASHPKVKTMLVSNFADAQAAAVAAGALPGFGKREIGRPRVAQVLQAALNNHEEKR